MIKEKTPRFRICSKCKREFTFLNTRECPHPKVKEKYGVIMCGYCCTKCQHSFQFGTGLKCNYK